MSQRIASFRILIFSILQPFFNLLYKRKAISLLTNRSRFHSGEINEIAKEIPSTYYYASTSEREKFNDLYGIATILKQYARIPNDFIIKAHIEHAIAFTDHLFSAETFCAYQSILLCGDFRALSLKSSGIKKTIFKIGPYINYARPFLTSTQFASEKKKLGRNLLVFPVHSVGLLEAHYDIEEFAKKINQIKKEKKFNNVSVCLFWKDIKLAKIYKKHGFKIVTAGNVYDPLFLPRLRSIIELSDMAITNGIGSHLGYCISLKRPIFLFQQTVTRDDPKNEFDEKFYRNYDQITKNLVEAFSFYSEKITKRQYNEANKFCGINHLKTPGELRVLLERLSDDSK